MAHFTDILAALPTDEKTKLLELIAAATNITVEGIVISDAQQPDNPIIYANEGFVRLTGYDRKDVLGRNCRFLQGEETDPDTIAEISQAVHSGRSCRVDILNYRKNGERFWNRLSITPLKDEQGNVINFVGVQFDITVLKETQDRLQQANKRLEQFQSMMNAELDQAYRAQQAILPPHIPQCDAINIATKFIPLSQIGGDFYDIVQVTDTCFGFFIADVTGHGIPAALITFMSATAFKNAATAVTSPQEVIAETNRRIVNKMPGGTFVTMFYMIYDTATHKLVYSQAGHPPALLIRPSTGEVIKLETKGTLVGILPHDLVKFTEKRIQLQPGDKVLMYTDAIIETISQRFEQVEVDHLTDYILDHIDMPITDLIEQVFACGLEWGEATQYEDDVTLVGFQVKQ